ncbi:MAG: glycosyltransferase [Sporocytophaga sp.]|uniref:glycosyltransferase n=1 Tax=Sporocytophaga sp. TaxID=2231183 RepID=UPI001B2BAD01|nr:glycosyltransferase [Sporocytophaga sp.]MBO9701648.1 glycosyltransferase [Sporocytophaga sp.]
MKEDKNIMILTYWSFGDALVQTYTLPYVKIIKEKCLPNSNLFVVTFEQKKYRVQPKRNVLNKVDYFKWVPLTYNRFGLRGILRQLFNLIYLLFFCKIKRINTIHSFCTPAGSIAYVLSKILNIKLIIDSFEPHAETMVETGTWKKNSLAYKMLFKFETLQANRAAFVIAAAEGMKEYAATKYGLLKTSDFLVKPACVDLELFQRFEKKNGELLDSLNLRDKIVCVYAGKFGSMYLEKEIFDLFKVAYDYWKQDFRVLLLTSHKEEEILNYCKASDLNPAIITIKFVPHNEVPIYMGLGDFGLTPFKPVPSKRYGSPIKTGEYWAMGLPVVITENISDNSDIIEKNGIGAIIKTFNQEGYLSVIKQINTLLKEDREALYKRIRNIASEERTFKIAEEVYQKVYCNDK